MATGLGTSPGPRPGLWSRSRMRSWLRFGSSWIFSPRFFLVSRAGLIVWLRLRFRGASRFSARCRPRTWLSLHFFFGWWLRAGSWIGLWPWKRSVTVFEPSRKRKTTHVNTDRLLAVAYRTLKWLIATGTHWSNFVCVRKRVFTYHYLNDFCYGDVFQQVYC